MELFPMSGFDLHLAVTHERGLTVYDSLPRPGHARSVRDQPRIRRHPRPSWPARSDHRGAGPGPVRPPQPVRALRGYPSHRPDCSPSGHADTGTHRRPLVGRCDHRPCRGQEDVTESYPGCRSGPWKSSQSRATRPVPIPPVLNVTQRCAHVYPRLPSNHRGMLVVTTISPAGVLR